MSEEPTEHPDEDEQPDDEEDVPDPVPPPEKPEDEGEPVEAELEAYEGFEDFVASIPGRATMTEASIKATEAALKSWMRRHGPGASGHYPRAQWQEYFEQAMAHA